MATAATYRAEVWQLPHESPWGKILPNIKFNKLAAEIELSDVGYGRLTVKGGAYLTNVIDTDNDHGSIIRIFDDTQRNVFTFFAENLDHDYEESVDEAAIHGPGIGNILEKMVVFPFSDAVSDWIWNGDDRLTDGGFEDVENQTEIYEVWVDPSVNSFTLEVGGDTTVTIDDHALIDEIEDALQDLPDLIDVLVSVSEETPSEIGTEDNPWRIEYVEPAFVLGIMHGAVVSGTGTVHIKAIQQGRGDVPNGQWTKSQFADARQDPELHGTYASGANGFRLDFDTVRTGNASLRVNGLTQYAGAQQIVSVTPGELFQVSAWVYTSDAAAEFKLVLRDRFEGFLAQDGGLIAGANTWTEYSITDFTVPAGVEEIIVRIAIVSPGNPLPFYIDDVSMKEGMAAATAGEVLLVLIGAAQTRGVGTWLRTAGITDLLDYDGNAWTNGLVDMTLRVPAGQTVLQLLDSLNDQGLEYFIEWNDSASMFDFQAWNRLGAGTVRPLVFHPRIGWRAASYTESLPPYTAVLGEGDNDIWSDAADASMVTGYGRWEGSADVPGIGLMTTNQIDAWLLKQLNQIETQRFAVRVTTKAVHRFDTDYKIGDTVGFDFAGTPIGVKTDRVASVLITVNVDEEPSTTTTVDFVKPVLFERFGGTTSSPTSYILNKFLRKYRRKIRPVHVNPRPATRGGDPTVFVAAIDASQQSKDIAHYIVEDPDDATVAIDAAQAVLIALATADVTGRLVLSEGHFPIPTPYEFGILGGEGFPDLTFDTHGMGKGRTVIQVTTAPTGAEIGVNFKGYADHLSVVEAWVEET